MSFGFSTGDITSALSITRKLLQDADLNQPGEDSLTETLKSLEAILLKFQKLKLSNRTSQPQYNALVEVSSQCQTSLERFLSYRRPVVLDKTKIKPQALLVHRDSKFSKPSNWSQKTLKSFRAEITGHVLSLVLLDSINDDSPTKSYTLPGLIAKDRFLLSDVQKMKTPVIQAICAVDRLNSMVDRTARIISTNLRIYHAVIDLQQSANRLPAQVEFQPPVILEDALGRRAPFHLEFVTSHKCLREILMLRFNNEEPLLGCIQTDDFVLSLPKSNRIIDLTQAWNTCFSPGDVVYMSILLQFQKKCLLCSSKIQLRDDERVRCDFCSTYYRPSPPQLKDNFLGAGKRPSLANISQLNLEVLPPGPLQGFIIKFLSHEFTKFPEFEIWGPTSVTKWDSSQFFAILSQLLKHFGSELLVNARNKFEKQIVTTILRRHRAIISSFKALVIRGGYRRPSSYPGAEPPRPHHEQPLVTETPNNNSLSTHPNSTSQNHLSRPSLEAEVHEAFQSRTESELTQDEAAVISFLTSGSTLTDLGRQLRKTLYFDSDPQAKFGHVDSKIMEGFRTLNSFRGNKPSEKLCATFKAFWELWQFSREELEGATELGPVMTLSGSAIYARATQCKVYLEENWGQVGLDVLRAIENALSSENLRTDVPPPSSPTPITVELHPKTHPDTTEYAIIKAFGSLETLKQVAHCLTWLTAAIRVSQYNYMSYSDAVFTDCTYLAPIQSKSEFQNSMYFEIYAQDLHELSKEERKMCWNPLFPHSVIADGFPIPKRANNIPGLEISFDIMANLSGVSYPINYSNGLILQGLTTMLVPTNLEDEDCMQWHFLSNPKGSRITLQAVDKNFKDWHRTQDLECLQKPRAFLGWSKEANIYLGTQHMDYSRMKCTKAIGPQQRSELSGYSLGASSAGLGFGGPSGGLNFTLGKKRRNEFVQQKDQDMEAALRKTKNIPLILYDPDEQRGWLVSALSVILHLAHVYALRWPELVTLNDQRVELPYAEPSSDGGEAALQAILGNHALPIHKSQIGNKPRCFIDLIQDIYFPLMAIMDINSRRDIPQKRFWQSQPVLCGYELMSVVSSPQSPLPKEHQLMETSGGWTNFAIDVLVLFGEGLGDIIRPCPGQNHLCEKWTSTPRSKDYLTANISMLQVLSDKFGYRESCHKLSESVQWIQSEDLFPDCRHITHRCHRPLQRLKNLTGREKRKEIKKQMANKPPGGAVIFGKPASKLPKMKLSFSRGSDDDTYDPKFLPADANQLHPGLGKVRHDSGYWTGEIHSEDEDSVDEKDHLMTIETQPKGRAGAAAPTFTQNTQMCPPAAHEPQFPDTKPENQDYFYLKILGEFGALLRLGLANFLACLVIYCLAMILTQGKLLK